MSVKAMQWVWEHSEAGGNLRLVLLAIADSADHDGDNAWPSVATIAAKCALSERTVQRAIVVLEEMGELVVDRQAGGTETMRADRRPNRYRLPLLPRGDKSGVTDRHPEPDGVTTEAPRGDNCDARGDNHDTTGCQPVAHGVTLLSPEPSLNHPRTVLEPSAFERDLAAVHGTFEDFWSSYPKQVARGAARREWRTALGKATGPTIVAAAQRYAERIADQDHRYVPNPATWLANEQWADTPPAPKPRMSQSARNLKEWASS